VGEEGLQNDDWRERHDRGPNLLGEVPRHRILDHIASREVPMTAVPVAAKVVLVQLDGLEVANVEPSTRRKEEDKEENERRGGRDTRSERREGMGHGGRTSEPKGVGRREEAGRQRTMEDRWKEAQASGSPWVDPPFRSSSRS
jgi:hypothetical protein